MSVWENIPECKRKSIQSTLDRFSRIQIRKDRCLYRNFRSHSYLNDGVSSIYYSVLRKLIYSCGYDGSIFLFSETENIDIPVEPINKGIKK